MQAVAEVKPELIFIYRGTHIKPQTLARIKALLPHAIIAGYNNDDPFGPGQPRMLWRHFLKCLPLYDLTLAYRRHNIAEYEAHGAQAVRLLRSWFMPERNHPVDMRDADRTKFSSDVVFVGHYESDGRLELLEEVVSQGYKLRLFGPGYDWDPAIAGSRWLKDQRPVQLVWGEDYNKALCGAKVALCFFSRLNRDTYTRRCFEIPATGTLMLCEYSDDAADLFAPGREADFFRDGRELSTKLQLYLHDDALRTQVAAGGKMRVWADGHDVISRMRQLLQWVEEINTKRTAAHA
jgi:spore maturation protein CgeB